MALMTRTPVMWTLEDGLEVVRRLQAGSRKFNYHLTIGGGVVNTGTSSKDLDLYFLPLDNERWACASLLVDWLESLYGPSKSLIDPHYSNLPSVYEQKLKFENGGKRIDVFIMKDSDGETNNEDE